MPQPSRLDKSKRSRTTLRTALTKTINKITEQLIGDEINNDKIEDFEMEYAEQVYRFDSEIHKVIDSIGIHEKDVAFE